MNRDVEARPPNPPSLEVTGLSPSGTEEAPLHSRPARSGWGVGLLCAALAFALYLPVVEGEFVFDDRKLVVENEELWRPYEGPGGEARVLLDRLGGIFRPEEAESPVRTAFRPIRFFSLRVDALTTRALENFDPNTGEPGTEVFHLHNILLHALNTLLLVLIVRTIAPRGPLWAAPFLGLLFAAHPIQTESVAYISGRRDVLFLFHYLLAVLLYLRGRESGGWGRGLLIAAIAWCALATKEMAASLPVTLLLLEGLAEPARGDRPGVRRVLDRLPLLLPTFVATSLFVFILLGSQNPGGGSDWWGGSPLSAFLTSGRAILSYVRLFLLPYPLSVDHSFDAFPPSTGWLEPASSLLAWIGIAGSILAAFLLRRRNPLTSISVLLFLVTIAPVAQWIPHPERFAEHHLYLPSIALLMVGAGALGSFVRRSPDLALAAGALLLLVAGGVTVDRLADWRSPYALWRSAAEVHPRCARAHFGWGNSAWQLQPPRPDEAVLALGRAAELWAPVARDSLQQGYYLQTLQIRAGILATSESPEDLEIAVGHLTALLEELDTDGTPVAEQPLVWTELMKLRTRRGEEALALECARRLVALDAPDPLRVQASLLIAAHLAEGGDLPAAEEALVDTLASTEDPRALAAIWYQVGVLRQGQELWAAAREAFERAAERIGPTGNRASALYKAAECRMILRDVAGARALLEEILDGDPKHLPALLSLGEVVLGQGELSEAERIFETILTVVPDEERARQGLAQARARQRAREEQATGGADPSRVSALLMLHERLLAEGRLADATQALIKAERNAEGPQERGRRIELRHAIARLLVRRSVEAERAGEETERDARLEEASGWYERHREVATPLERESAAVEAAEVSRRLSGPATALAVLAGEYEAGVRGERILRSLAGLSQRSEDPAAIERWVTLYQEAVGAPSAEGGDAKGPDRPSPSAGERNGDGANGDSAEGDGAEEESAEEESAEGESAEGIPGEEDRAEPATGPSVGEGQGP